MSKKILKRSLALGVLMAFVITGNVWANVTIDLSANDERGAIQLFESGALNCNLSDYKLIINAPSSNGIWVNGYAYDIKGSDNSTLQINSAYNGLGAHGKVDVGTLDITAGCYAIQGYSNNTIIKADNIKLTASNAGLNVISDYPTQSPIVDIDFDESLIITGIDGASGIESLGHSGTLSVNGAEDSVLTINTTGYAIRANYNSKVYINTELDTNNKLKYFGGSNTTITGNIEAQDSAKINLGLKGEQSKFTGKVATGEDATANLILEGGTWNVTDDSTISKIVVDGDTTIDGTKEDGGKSSLTSNRDLTAASEYLIEHKGGTLTINNLVIKDVVKENKSDSTGSIIKRNNGGKIIITNSEFRNNQNVRADGFSGKTYAIIDIDSDMDISDTKFLNNKTDYMGGALYLHNKEFNITNSTFENNTALQGAAIQSNGAKITLTDNIFKNNVATKDNDGDCGGAICAEGASELIFEGTNNSFESNKATGTNGNGGAIAQYKGAKELTTIIFAEGSSTEFKNNTANNNGGAIWNGDGGVIEVNGKLNFTGNTANGKGNDIYNIGTININQGAKVKLDGGIDGTGTTNINGGTLELAGGKTSIETLGGNGGVIHFSNADAQLAVTKNENETLKFTATSAVNEAVAGDANKLINQVAWAKDTTMVMEAGEVVGEVTAELVEGEDGKLVVKSQTEATNTKNQSIGEAGVSLKLHYRAHMNDMNKRMGELRNANGEYGVWTRMVRGESEYENTKAQYNLYQLGYDEKLSVDKRWTVGAAVTFAEGDANYGQGSTDDKSTAFVIYGTKLNNDGTFVDLIARYAHLESDFDDRNSGKGDYSTNGMSVSAEFGKRIQQGNGLWIEPQVELTYGTVDSAEFQLGGKTVTVGDMDSIIGRVGFSLGKDIKQGNVYARASYLYDFDGETENAFSANGVTRTIVEDLGGGWWEVGVGANINLSKATYIYADVEKTFGGEVDTNWQWNLGVRYSF